MNKKDYCEWRSVEPSVAVESLETLFGRAMLSGAAIVHRLLLPAADQM
jgi:hypothetical protein